MRFSREKMVHLSHVLVKALESKETVEFNKPSNDVRLSIFNTILKFMKLDERIEDEVRRKLTSFKKKDVPEGSREWDIQYRKFYEDEWEKVRKIQE